MNDLDGRPTAQSRVTLSRIMTAIDVNLYGTVHGGVLMKFVDDVAGAAAARHSGGTAVTAAIDEIVFVEPVRVGDLVHASAQVNWTGSTSMEFGVKLAAER
jgi:acyl-CoA hydrolase